MKKAFIALCTLIVVGAGVFYYFYLEEENSEEAKHSLQSFMHQARNLTNELIRYRQSANDNINAEWEKTHSNEAIIAAVENLIDEEWLSGRNQVGGKNWTEKMNILSEICKNICSLNEDAKIVYDSMSFNGMMGNVRFELDTIMPPYYVSDSAWVDVHFAMKDTDGTPFPNSQKVTMKLLFNPSDKRWLINDFVFYYNEYGKSDQFSEMREMNRLINEYSQSGDMGEMKEEEEIKEQKE